MELSIRTRAIEVTDGLRDLMTRRIELALDTFKGHTDSASVYVCDLNGPRKGIDKLCQITVLVHGVGKMVVVERGSTVTCALNRAVGRVKYRVSEAIRRAVRHSRESIRRSPPAA
jgi:putative sigma-54 modulation protein